ncbi:MAG: hypothetical protein AB7D36_06095 [Oscillospiraceae bacterium]
MSLQLAAAASVVVTATATATAAAAAAEENDQNDDDPEAAIVIITAKHSNPFLRAVIMNSSPRIPRGGWGMFSQSIQNRAPSTLSELYYAEFHAAVTSN